MMCFSFEVGAKNLFTEACFGARIIEGIEGG
jgi:hypothetical protein